MSARFLPRLSYLLAAFCLFCCAPLWAVPAEQLRLDRPVIDQAQLLDAASVARIENRLYALRDQALVQAAVVIVDSTDGVEAFDYALSLARRWQLGDAQANNGLLFLVALQDRRFFILTGRGIEGALPDVSVARIQRNQLVPAFRQGQYVQGIENTLNALITQLEADPDTRAQMIAADKKADSGDPLEQVLPAAMMIFVLCFPLAMLLGKFVSGLLGGAAVAGLSYFIFGLGALSFVFGFFFFVIFLFFFGAQGASGGSRPIIISGGSGGFSGGNFGGGRSYGGGGGSFSGGGAGGSW